MLQAPLTHAPHLRNRIDWDALAELIHLNAVSKGFWPAEGRNFGEMLCLMHSEVTEAYDAALDGLPDDKIPNFSGFSAEISDVIIRLLDTAHSRNIKINNAMFSLGTYTVGEYDSLEKDLMKVHKWISNALEANRKGKDVAYALMVTLAYLLSVCAKYAIDIADVIEAKMTFNASRPYKHGKAF